MIRNIYLVYFVFSDVSNLNLVHEKVPGGTNLQPALSINHRYETNGKFNKTFFDSTSQMQQKLYVTFIVHCRYKYSDSKAHGANMGPIWGRQEPGGPHVGPHELCYLGSLHRPGPRLNIKTVFPRYGHANVKDETVVRPSYL